MVTLRQLASRAQARYPYEPFNVWQLPQGPILAAFYRTEAGFLVRFPDLADFELSADGRRAICWPSPNVSEATVEHLYRNQIMPLALGKLGKLVFHASAVELGDGAITFAGASGRGKSTVAAAFAMNGNPFLADDGVLLDGAPGTYVIRPSHPSLRLTAESEKHLLCAPWHSETARESGAKAQHLASKRLTYCRKPKRLLAAYFLGEGSVSDVFFRPLGAVEAVIQWAGQSFLLDISDESAIERHFDGIVDLTNSVPCFSLDYPRRYDALPVVLDRVRTHVRELVSRPE